MDDIVCGPADRLDQRLHCVPRGRGTDSSTPSIRCDLAHSAFCHGQTDCLELKERNFQLAPVPAIAAFIDLHLWHI